MSLEEMQEQIEIFLKHAYFIMYDIIFLSMRRRFRFTEISGFPPLKKPLIYGIIKP